MPQSKVISFPAGGRRPPRVKESLARMKNGLVKRGRYYHYKVWDKEVGKNVWRSTRQTTWDMANQWVQVNILNPQREKLHDESLGIKPIKKATFKEFVEREYWPSALEKNNESTVKANRHKMKWLERFFGKMELIDISEGLIEDYKVWRKRQKKKSCGKGNPKGSTINRELKLLSRVCKYALKRDYLREEPTRKIDYYKEKPVKVTVISKKDFEERFLPNCNARNRYATRELFEFGFRTGARLGEITGLKWEDVDFDNGHIAFMDTKNNEAKIFPMSDYLRKLLERLYDTRISEYVFPHGNGNKRQEVRAAFKNTLERAGLPRMHFHELRHSFVSVCASMGMTWEQVSELTGHKTYAMFRRYKHLFHKEQKKLLDRWDES